MASDTAAVVLAAGSGRRMGGGINKALLPLHGKPLLAHTIQNLRAAPSVAQIVVVMSDLDHQQLQEKWGMDVAALGGDLRVEGDKERWLSCKNGCLAADPALPLLLIQDAARALTQAETTESVLKACREYGAALAAEPLADTLKKEGPGGKVAGTVPRESLWKAQTPQAATRKLLLQALDAWPGERGVPTDEAMMLEAIGVAPALVPAPGSNFKITFPSDLEMAEAILQAQASLS